ncbi:hypothetical protein I5T88_06405 [Stenotrophomonas maltophilia]|nr:hypothetical protein [Stenotrophomonas maltophilia]
MSAPVDVLAVLRYNAREATKKWGPDNQDAATLSAISELLVAVEPAISEEGMDQPELDRLRAAVARVRGGAA